MDEIQDKRLLHLLELLSQDICVSSATLSLQLEISSKTIRRLIKNLDYHLQQNGAKIISKHGQGYLVTVIDQNQYQQFIEMIKQYDVNHSLPQTSAERIQFLLEYLLNHNHFIKLEDLTEKLYVSKNTLSSDLRKVEEIIEKYNLSIIRKPNYGIALKGNEFDLRLCLASFSAQRLLAIEDNVMAGEENEIKLISDIIINCAGKRNFKVNEMAFQNLIVHIYVAMKRINQNHQIFSKDEQNSLIGEPERRLAEDIVHCLEEAFKTRFPVEEIEYIAIHLAGKQVYEFINSTSQNVVIQQEVSDLVTAMLESVNNYFKIDFRGNLELRMMLSQHLVPLLVRVEHDMNLKNPLLKDVKKKYIFSYMIAAQAATVIASRFGKRLSDDEVAYIALPFALALERQKSKIEKKNILFVCSTGQGSAELLVYKFTQEFGTYIDQIQICNLYQVQHTDFSNIDYIFTTVPISTTVPVPIMEVSFFLQSSEIEAMKEIFSSDKTSSTERFFSEKLFFSAISVVNREQAIKTICDQTGQVIELPDGFFDAVLIRESLAKTDFGNLVALPHPYKLLTSKTFVSVGILKEPIKWLDYQVQVIFLISIAEGETEDIQKFYQTIVKLISSRQYIQELIKNQSFSTLTKLLAATEKENDDGK